MNAVLKHGIPASRTTRSAAKYARSADYLIVPATAVASNAATASAPWLLPDRKLSLDNHERMRRAAAWLLIALAHVAIIYAIVHWSPQIKILLQPPLEVTLLTEIAPQNHAVKDIVPPKLTQPELKLPMPTVAVENTEAIALPSSIVAETTVVTLAPTGASPKLVSSVEMEYLRSPKLRYPAAARALRQSGVVILRALVDTTGHTREVIVHRSSGSRVLDDAGRTAVLEAQFKPYIENGRAIEVYVLMPIEFSPA